MCQPAFSVYALLCGCLSCDNRSGLCEGSSYVFLFNGCPRGAAQEWADGGRRTLAQCQQLCDTQPDCIAIEVNGCLSGPNCYGSCYTFTGNAAGTITNGGCVTNGDRKAYRKVQSIGGTRRPFLGQPSCGPAASFCLSKCCT